MAPATISSVAVDFASGAIVQVDKAIAVLASGERFLTMEKMASLGEAFRRFENDGRFCEGIAALRSLLLTGARLREILRLQWVNVDMERALLFLSYSKTEKKAITLNASALAVLQTLERVGEYVIPGVDPRRPRPRGPRARKVLAEVGTTCPRKPRLGCGTAVGRHGGS